MEILSCSTQEQIFSLQRQLMVEEVKLYFDLRRKYLCVPRLGHQTRGRGMRLTEKNIKTRKERQKCVCCCCCCLVGKSCPTYCNPMGCSPPGSSVHGTFQAGILELVAISFSRGSSSEVCKDGQKEARTCSKTLSKVFPRKIYCRVNDTDFNFGVRDFC